MARWLSLFALAACWAPVAHAACLCERLSTAETLAKTDLAVAGMLVQATWSEEAKGQLPAGTTVFTLEPSYVLKGEAPRKVKIVDDSHLTACSLNLNVGQVRQLMLTYNDAQGVYHADYCLNRPNQSTARYWREHQRPVE